MDSVLEKTQVHRILTHSYVIYFILFLAGVMLDLVYKIKIFNSTVMVPAGIFLLAFSTVIIFWAQKTSRNLSKQNLSAHTFCRGPYCYSRSPTHWGLFFLTLGFGIVANALFVVLATLISFLLSRILFLEKQEHLLEKKYGAPYLEYKRMVRL